MNARFRADSAVAGRQLEPCVDSTDSALFGARLLVNLVADSRSSHGGQKGRFSATLRATMGHNLVANHRSTRAERTVFATSPLYFQHVEKYWCQKRHRIEGVFGLKYNDLRNVAFLKSPKKARKLPITHWFDAFFRTRARDRARNFKGLSLVRWYVLAIHLCC